MTIAVTSPLLMVNAKKDKTLNRRRGINDLISVNVSRTFLLPLQFGLPGSFVCML